jgi:hypothetical protein
VRPEVAVKNLIELLAGRRIKERLMILRLSAAPGGDDSMETANGGISSRSHTDWHAGDSAR